MAAETDKTWLAVTNTSLLTKMCQCNERLSAIAPELLPKDVTPMLAQIAQRICSAERVNVFVWYACSRMLSSVLLSSTARYES